MQQICFSQTPVTGPADSTSAAVTLPRPTVDPHASGNPVYNDETGKVEKPVLPAKKTYYQDIAVLALPAEGVAAREQVIDLSSKMIADGHLTWTPPAGRWIVYRFGHTTTGALVEPAPWKATGLECDKMNPEAVAFHLNHVLGELKKHCADVIGHGLEYVWFDSYEAGTPNWTPKMREEFRARRGYDLTPFLATFAKRTVGSAEESKRFAADFKRTVADLYRDVYFGVSAQIAHAAGLQIRSEPYEGPWVVSEVVPKFDQVAAEFWSKNGGKYSPYMVKEVVAGARAAHQNLVTGGSLHGVPGRKPVGRNARGVETGGRPGVLRRDQPLHAAPVHARAVWDEVPARHRDGAVGHALRPHADVVGTGQGLRAISDALPGTAAMGGKRQPGG